MCFLIKNAWWWQKFFAIWYIFFNKFEKKNLSYSYIAMSTLKHILKKKEVAKGFISNFYRILEKKLLGPFLFKIKFKNKSWL